LQQADRLIALIKLQTATNMRDSDTVVRMPFKNGNYYGSAPGERSRY